MSGPAGAGARQALDLRLVPTALAAWSVAFIGVVLPAHIGAVTAGAFLVAALGAAWGLGRSPHRAAVGAAGPGSGTDTAPGPYAVATPHAAWVLALVAAALVLGSAAAQVHQRGSGPLGDLVAQGAVVTVTGRVVGDPALVQNPPERGGGQRTTVPLRVDLIEGRGMTARARAPLLVLAPEGWIDLALGHQVRTSGRLVATDRGEPVVALVIVHGDPQVLAEPPPHHRLANRMRAGLVAAVAGASPQAQGLVPGIAVGDDSRLPGRLDEAMKTVSLTHITAVSGAHVAIILGAALALLTWSPRWFRAGVGVVVLVCFVVLVRPEASVLRSATMGGVALLALLLGRPSRALSALCCAVVVLLVLDPWLARSYGFVLSVLATTGLVLLAGPWAAVLSRWLPRTLAHVIAVPAAAQVCCAPVIILLEPAVATYAVPANVLAVPAVPPATVLGVLATVVVPWLPQLAAILATVAGWFTAWIAWVALACAGLPGASMPWPAGVGGAALLGLLTITALLVARPGYRGRLPVAAAGGLALVLVLVPGPRRTVEALLDGVPPDWVAVQCDVGQGSGFVLRDTAGHVVMVDVGPPGPAAAECLRRLGVRELELLVLTHVHADHVGGLPQVLDAVPVRQVLLSPHRGPAAAEESVAELLASSGVSAARAVAGDFGTVGEVRWRVLWPTSRASELATPQDPAVLNDLSLTVLLQTPQVSVLAPGDLEPAGQRGLLRELQGAGGVAVDVVLVPHHGSAAQLPGLAAELDAPLALVSVGQDNDHGHPAPETLELYGRRGALVLRTDECGAIAVVVDDGGLGAVC